MMRRSPPQKSCSVTTRLVTLQRAPPLTRIFAPTVFAPSAQTMRLVGAARAQKIAAASPAAPAPTITTSAVWRCGIQQRRTDTDVVGEAYKMQFNASDARPPESATASHDAKQEDRMKRFTSIAAAVFTAAFLTAATTASEQDSNINQRTFLTFSGPVQMPGVTLPAGKYVFRLADTALHNVMQVFDGDEKRIIGQWFFIPKNRTTEEASAANGKPVVMFKELPEGFTPAIQYYFYPTDLTGKEFIYPKEQALKIAAATHQTVLATDTEVGKGEAHVFRVEPNGTESQYQANATASTAVSEPAPSSTTSEVNNAPAPAAPSYSAPSSEA